MSLSITCNLHPVTPETMVYVPSDNPLVTKSPFLAWSTNNDQPNLSGLPHAIFTKLFLPKCYLNPDHVAQHQFQNFNPLTFRLTADAWQRILTQYIDSGLLDADFNTVRELQDVIQNLTIIQPTALQLEPQDINAAETFDAPATAGAQHAAGRGKGRGRGAQELPAQPAVPGPPALNFINLTSINTLQNHDTPNPLTPLAQVAGLLGACHTRASRLPQTSPAALFADLVVPNICSRLGAPNASPALVASNLADFLTSNELPDIYRPDNLSPSSCREELLDGIHFRGSREQRVTVERRRCLRLGAR